jgi:hypothetical protein
LSVDYILHEEDGLPRYIDCNPRLVEPMNALLSGLDLTDLLVRVSLGEQPSEAPDGREGVRTHLAIQALFGCCMRSRSRWALLSECWKLVSHSGIYSGSCEELTPVRWDWPSAVPALIATLLLLANPGAGSLIPNRSWGAHLLDTDSLRMIRALPAPTDRVEE